MISKINLNELLIGVLAGFKKEEIDFKIESLPIIYGDRNLVKQVFVNLIENAIKYKKPNENNSYLHIYSEFQQGKYHIFIVDNGIGIEEENYESVFQIFSRYNLELNESGAGIGLAIVKRIIEKHGWDINVNCVNGETIFELVIYENN